MMAAIYFILKVLAEHIAGKLLAAGLHYAFCAGTAPWATPAVCAVL